jgi:hypothetical protein
MRNYDKIDFLPMQQAPSNIYNTFKGYEAEKTELIKTDIENSLMLKHIKHLCNNDDIVFNYFIKFIANLLKSPYNISKTAIILKSVQGCGKDTFFDWFGNNILGSDYYINTDKAELIFGRFNSCIENKISHGTYNVSGHEKVDYIDIIKEIKKADIVITGVGKPKMIIGEMVKEGATVIDIGFSHDENGKAVGERG